MYKVPGFLKRDKDALIFNDDGQLIYYIPEIFFERKYATNLGEYIRIMGIFEYERVDKNGKSLSIRPFNFPSFFLCRPSEVKKIKDFELKNAESQDYRLLIFKKGDEAVTSVKVPQDVENSEDFYKIYTTGKLPTNIPYDKIQDYFIDNIRLNGADYGLNIQMFGFIISEICRSREDIKKSFRHTDIKNMTDYRTINIKQIPKMISPFTSITSENWDEAVVNAISNKNAKYSPLEKLFTL